MKTVDAFAGELKELADRVSRLEGTQAPPSDVDAAKALLSGLLPRQRIHWSQEILHTDRLAVTAIVALWALFLNSNGTSWSWKVAMASGLAAILIGLWRWYARYLDNAIANLYPSIMYYEKVLGIRPEHSALLDLRRTHGDCVETVRQLVKNKTIGTRGHLPFDWIALALILAMAIGTIRAGSSESVKWGSWRDPLHPYALLTLNVLGILCVVWAMNAYQTDGKRFERVRRSVRQTYRDWKMRRDQRAAS